MSQTKVGAYTDYRHFNAWGCVPESFSTYEYST